jgi:hypothetical protein
MPTTSKPMCAQNKRIFCFGLKFSGVNSRYFNQNCNEYPITMQCCITWLLNTEFAYSLCIKVISNTKSPSPSFTNFCLYILTVVFAVGPALARVPSIEGHIRNTHHSHLHFEKPFDRSNHIFYKLHQPELLVLNTSTGTIWSVEP